MAIISGYFDDSDSTGDVWVVGGWVGYLNQWDLFEQLWGAALDKHGVPYFHMREMANHSGPFAKWRPPEDHQDEVIAFFRDLIAAIKKCNLHMFTSAVWMEDIKRFNRENGTAIEAYPLMAYSCMAFVGLHYSGLPVTMTFDHIDKVDSKLVTARTYAESDSLMAPGVCDRVATAYLPKAVTAKDVRPMQAADLIAWEARKALFNMKPWQLLPDRPISDDRESMWRHFLEWHRETRGKDLILRKSMGALMANLRTQGVIWDYQQLCDANRARGGVWMKAAA